MIPFDDYLRGFDYQERKAMKIGREPLLEGLRAGRLQLVDIRFREEYAAWHLGFGLHIPLNELPDRLHELDRGRPVVTLCPHYDRAEIARLYLRLQGFDARYCTDGLLGIVEYLRGDRAREYLEGLGS